MYKIAWEASVLEVDIDEAGNEGDTSTVLAQFSNSVKFDNIKLLQKAATVVGEQVFQMAAESSDVK